MAGGQGRGDHAGVIKLARVYVEPTADDGHRVLVDRLWPRGVRKSDPRIGEWLPDIAPSTELRHWYDHRAERYEEFRRRYLHELESDGAAAAALVHLRGLAASGPITLTTATKAIEGSHLPVLEAILRSG